MGQALLEEATLPLTVLAVDAVADGWITTPATCGRIISLHREDAERLRYDHADAWRTLLRTHRNDIAAAMKIPPEDFRWYAAFHDEAIILTST